jgi:endonuclease YncB( thermonuclease family)
MAMRKLVPYLLALLIFTGLVACSSLPDSDRTGPDSPPAGEPAHVVFVIDGDTIDVESQGETFRVRYIGVDTPERDEPFYEQATEANRNLVDGEEIILVQDVSETDQYGRLLRYAYLQDGTFVNAELISSGYDRVVTFPPDVAQADLFADLHREARENQRGLWSLSEMQDLPPGCDTCSKNNYNCKDFDSQAAAQACFDYCLDITGEDIHHLDGGGDGVVCKSLP